MKNDPEMRCVSVVAVSPFFFGFLGKLLGGKAPRPLCRVNEPNSTTTIALRHSATQYNTGKTLQHTATHCNAPQQPVPPG